MIQIEMDEWYKWGWTHDTSEDGRIIQVRMDEWYKWGWTNDTSEDGRVIQVRMDEWYKWGWTIDTSEDGRMIQVRMDDWYTFDPHLNPCRRTQPPQTRPGQPRQPNRQPVHSAAAASSQLLHPEIQWRRTLARTVAIDYDRILLILNLESPDEMQLIQLLLAAFTAILTL